jgi:hypothetical protein
MLFFAWLDKNSGGVTGEFTREGGMSIHSTPFGMRLSPVEVADLWDAASALNSDNPRVEYKGWAVALDRHRATPAEDQGVQLANR